MEYNWTLWTCGIYYTWVVNGNENVVVVVNDSAWHTWQCELSVTRHDEDWPEIKYMTWEVNECEWISIEITAIDSWCAAWISWYKYWLEYWNELWQENNELIITAEQIWRTWNVEKQQNVTVVDKKKNNWRK